MKNISLGVTILSIIVGIVSIIVALYGFSDNPQPQNTIIFNTPIQTTKPEIKSVSPSKIKNKDLQSNDELLQHKAVTLVISGTGAEVTIKKSSQNTPYLGGHVSSTGAKQVIYLPKGQPLKVMLSGTGADLIAEKSIIEQLSINNTGTGSTVSLF